MINPLLIIILAFLYGVEYFIRFYYTKNYINFGKGLARFLVMGVYIWIFVYTPPDHLKVIFVRWSLAMLLAVDVFYIAQVHIMKRLGRHAS